MRIGTQRAGRILSIGAAVMMTVGLWGCAGGGAAGAKTLTEVKAAYDAGRYEESYGGATKLARSASGATSEQASYLAGLSAYQLKRYDAAASALNPVTSSKDPALAGRAAATLGMVRIEQNRPKEAVPNLKKAITTLQGEDLAEAEYHLGKAYQLSGDTTNARAHFTMARRTTTSAELRARANEELDKAGYALQIGAYGSLANAKVSADAFDRSGKGAGLGAARIVQSRDRFGKTLYLVQVGYFANLETAQQARTRIGSSAIITQNTALAGAGG